MFGLGLGEIVLLFLLVMLFFGARRIPEIARGLGKGIREFKTSVKEPPDRIESGEDDTP